MPLFHCTKCHHEWEHSGDKESICDWCGAPGKILEEKTPMESVDWSKLLERLNELSKESRETGKPIVTSVQKQGLKKRPRRRIYR
jgi:hypothetical protein